MNLLMHPPGAVPRSGTYSLDPDHCAVELSARHRVAQTVRARVAPLGGELHMDATDLAASSVWIDLDADSFTTGHAARDEVMKGPELFDVDRFPFIRFESRSVSESDPGRLKVTGDLYIRDQVGEVNLDVRLLSTDESRVTWLASAALRRSAFGLRWADRFERLGLLVGDLVKVRLGVEFAA
jgi:polyisoprenoid-binding protein YceI